MCGRFTLHLPPEHLAAMFEFSAGPEYLPRYNVAPGQKVAVIRRSAGGSARLDLLRWGLIPRWAEDATIGFKLINARSETVHEKHSFRQSFNFRRCLIPASGFYEWASKTKNPMYIHRRDASPMVFAGLWEKWTSQEKTVIESCTILTTTANKLIATVHDRMPVILHPAEFDLWLDHEVDPLRLSRLYQPYPSELLAIYPVSHKVNSTSVDSPDLIIPLMDTDRERTLFS